MLILSSFVTGLNGLAQAANEAANVTSFSWDVATASTVLKVIQTTPAKLKVVNLWATWCPPCQKEIPEFIRFGKAYEKKGVRLIFVSGDSPEDRSKAETFLKTNEAVGRHFQLAEINETALKTFAAKWAGALPATFLYDEKGQLVNFWVGSTKYSDLELRVKSALDPKSAKR